MSRLPDWQHRLTVYLAGVNQRPHAYGSHDCALFCAGAVAAMTGTDHAAGLRGCYTTRAGGLKALRKRGYADHIDMAAQLYPDRAPAFLCPGDLAVVPGDGGEALGVVQGEWIYVVGADHIGYVPLLTALRGFAI